MKKQQTHRFLRKNNEVVEVTMGDVLEGGLPIDEETGEDLEYIGPKEGVLEDSIIKRMDSLNRDIDGFYGDCIKYPQLKLNDHNKDRLASVFAVVRHLNKDIKEAGK